MTRLTALLSTLLVTLLVAITMVLCVDKIKLSDNFARVVNRDLEVLSEIAENAASFAYPPMEANSHDETISRFPGARRLRDLEWLHHAKQPQSHESLI